MAHAPAFETENQKLTLMFQKYAIFTKDDKTFGKTKRAKEYYLGLREMTKLFKDHEIALNTEDMLTVFKLIDENGDGKISLDEFVSGMTDRSGLPKVENIRSLFDTINVIHDGAITLDELHKSAIGKELSNGLVQMVYKELDESKTGKVTFTQFLDFFKN